MKIVIETEDKEIIEKVSKYLKENKIEFYDNCLEKERLVKLLNFVKEKFEENNIGPVDIILESHYHPDYNADELMFDAPGYNDYGYGNQPQELKDLHKKIYNIMYEEPDEEFDFHFELYSLEDYQDDIEEILSEIDFEYNEIIIGKDPDH